MTVSNPQRSNAPIVLGQDEIRTGFAYPPLGDVRQATFDAYTLGQLRFFRPMRGPDDLNANDFFDTAHGDDVQVDVKTSTDTTLLQVSIDHADPATPDTGQPVRFSAGSDATGGVRYLWDFGDGTSAEGQMLSHP